MKPIDVKMQFEEFTPENLGRPKWFDPDHYLDSVEQMVSADEVIFALEMIDRMPAYYRQHPTERAKQLKADIYKQIWNVSSYVSDEYETYENSLRHQAKINPGYDWEKHGLGAMVDIPFCYPRAPLAIQLVKDLNEKGIIPHIWEMGPSNFYLPYGFLAKGLKFNYYADTLQKDAWKEAKEKLKDVWQEKPKENQTEIFICFETIEHLWNESDILHQYHRYGAKADHIMISTPCGTLLGGVPDYKRDLGHLRTYSPRELFLIVSNWWPEFDWSECINHMMVLSGKRRK